MRMTSEIGSRGDRGASAPKGGRIAALVPRVMLASIALNAMRTVGRLLAALSTTRLGHAAHKGGSRFVAAVLAAIAMAPATATAQAITVEDGEGISGSLFLPSVTLESGSEWVMTGNSSIGDLSNSGDIILTPPVNDPTQSASYKTLEVTTYTGQGPVVLNTFLGGDGSPSDRFNIYKAASGNVYLSIANTDGGGAPTTAGAGIKVASYFGAAQDQPEFLLQSAVSAGPYDYTLREVSQGQWSLVSSLAPAAAASPQLLGLRPELLSAAPEDRQEVSLAAAAAPLPHYRQEVSLAVAAPVLAALYGRSLIGTFHERFADQRLPVAEGDADPDLAMRGAWGRLLGVDGSHDGHSEGIYGGTPAFDYSFGALQAGLDLYAREYANGHRDIAGAYLAIGHGRGDMMHDLVHSEHEAGADTFDAVSIGGYWTHLGQNDWYLDGVVQGTWYDIEMDSMRGLPAAETDAFGFAASLEGGYPFDLGNGWRLEPQTQLVYQALDVSALNDGAADIRFSDEDSLAGRIGARLSRSWSVGAEDSGQGNGGAQPRQFTLWARTDLWHEFLGEPVTEFSSALGFVPFTADVGDSWAKLGVGGAFELSNNVMLSGDISYDTTFDADAHAWEGKVGLKVKW